MDLVDARGRVDMAGYAVREAAVGVDATGYAVGEGRGVIDLARVVPLPEDCPPGG